MEVALATTVVVIGLTMYTFGAAKRGQDFGFLAPLLLSILLLLFLFSVFQVLYPVGRMSDVIYSGLSTMLFCGYIVYETGALIKKHSYENYIWASIFLYLDVLNLFLQLIRLIRAVIR